VNMNTDISLFLGGAEVVDVDTHLSEAPDLWLSRAPAKYRARVPQLKDVNGRPSWFIDGDRSLGLDYPVSTILKDGTVTSGSSFMSLRHEDVHPASYGGHARVELMDTQGVWAQIIYPNILGFSGKKSMEVDPEIRLVTTQIYNDAMAEMQSESGDRLLPVAVLPWWDIEESIEEARRVAKLGLRGVSINPDPHPHGVPDLGNAAWDPFWEVCAAESLPVSFHIGLSDSSFTMFTDAAWPSLNADQNMLVGGANVFLGNVSTLTNIIISGVLERHPELRVVSVESGLGWIPFILNALDYQMNNAGPGASNRLKMLPSEYFRRQCYATFWFEGEHLADFVRMLGADNCMFETDFPHPVCLYPNPVEKIRPALERLPKQDQIKVMSTNAMTLYRIPSRPGN